MSLTFQISGEVYCSYTYLLLCFDGKPGDLGRAMIGILAKSSLRKTTRNNGTVFIFNVDCLRGRYRQLEFNLKFWL